MLASAGDPPAYPGAWAVEAKWDGFRALCYTGPDSTRFLSRKGNDLTVLCPEPAALGSVLGRSVILDGELVAFEEGRPSFDALRARLMAGRDLPKVIARAPVAFIAFDVLWLGGERVTNQPYSSRREILESLDLKDERWQVTDSFPGQDGPSLQEATRQTGLEGIVAKRIRSLYRCGERSADWVKVKNYQTETFTMGGWVTDEAGLLRSLLVGYLEGRGLRYAGEIQYGFRPGERARLESLLESLTRNENPFVESFRKRNTIYVDPRVDAEIRFLTIDSAGLFRHATYRGLAE